MFVTRHNLLLRIAVALLMLAPLCARSDALSDADSLIRQGKAAQAYTLLEPLEQQRAGEPAFDYLLGLAALESGKAGRATFALERVLAIDPQHAAARLDLGRAYYALGDYARARTELETAATMNPPPAARAMIDNYLAAMKTPDALPSRTLVYIEAGGGYDSNVNVAINSQTIYVPFFERTATFDADSLRQSAGYGTLMAGGEWTTPFLDSLSHQGAVDLGMRRHSDTSADDYDSESYSARLSIATTGRASFWRTSWLGQRYNRADEQDYGTNGLLIEHHKQMSSTTRRTIFSQYSQLRYVPVLLRTSDADQTALGAGLTRLYGTRTTVMGSLYAGYEEDPNDRADGEKTFAGIRLGSQFAHKFGLTSVVGLGIQSARYGKENLFFETRRKDTLSDLTAKIIWQMKSGTSLRLNASYVKQHSNIEINNYSRYDVSLSLKHEFR